MEKYGRQPSNNQINGDSHYFGRLKHQIMVVALNVSDSRPLSIGWPKKKSMKMNITG
jgi:hypothetical protein